MRSPEPGRARYAAELAGPAGHRLGQRAADAQPRRHSRLSARDARRRRRDEDDVVAGLAAALRAPGRPARRLGVRAAPDRRRRLRGPRARRDARVPHPAAAVAAVLPRPRHDPAARGRDDHGARARFLALTAVNQAYSLSIFALNLVIGLGLGLAIDYTLFLVTRFREELAQGQPGRRPDHGAHRRSHGRLQRGDGGARARHADGLPARVPEVDGDRGRRRLTGRRRRRAGDRARDRSRSGARSSRSSRAGAGAAGTGWRTASCGARCRSRSPPAR